MWIYHARLWSWHRYLEWYKNKPIASLILYPLFHMSHRTNYKYKFRFALFRERRTGKDRFGIYNWYFSNRSMKNKGISWGLVIYCPCNSPIYNTQHGASVYPYQKRSLSAPPSRLHWLDLYSSLASSFHAFSSLDEIPDDNCSKVNVASCEWSEIRRCLGACLRPTPTGGCVFGSRPRKR